MNKIKNFSLLAVLIFILFYSSTLIYSFTNIYLSFKQESSFQLQDFIDKKKLSLNFRKQLNKKELDGLLAYTGKWESNKINRLISGRIRSTRDRKKFKERIDGMDPGAPINPRIGKKFLITTIITSIIFIVIYYLVKFDLLNLREYLQ